MINLSGIVADSQELDSSETRFDVDGVHPRYVCTPGSVEEMSASVRAAHDANRAVVPWGGGTRMAIGFPPRAADLVVRTERLNEIVEYEPADLTVTVQAGIVLGALQERLRAEGQMLALDPAAADRATIGGLIAANASGPLRLLYGSARDLVIGTRVVNGDGVVSKAGGRVVKNVAGYDLNKLYVGSLGTVGIVVELSFKLHPLPQSEGVLLAAFTTVDQAAEAVGTIYRSPLNPAALELLDARAALEVRPDLRIADRGCLLAAVGSGFETAVDRQLRDMGAMCVGAELQTVRDGSSIDAIWRGLRELADPSAGGIALLKAAVPPARSAATLDALRSAAGDFGFSPALQARAGSGIVYVRLAPAAWDAETIGGFSSLVERARAYCRGESGSLVVEACPPEAKADLDIWGDPGSAFSVMRALKENLDPKATLNPGRFVGRL